VRGKDWGLEEGWLVLTIDLKKILPSVVPFGDLRGREAVAIFSQRIGPQHQKQASGIGFAPVSSQMKRGIVAIPKPRRIAKTAPHKSKDANKEPILSRLEEALMRRLVVVDFFKKNFLTFTF
jgi:hypothetical protein